MAETCLPLTKETLGGELRIEGKRELPGKELGLSKVDTRAIEFVFFYFLFLKILFIYLTEIETASDRGNTSRGSGRRRSSLPAKSPMQAWIAGPWDHALSRRQTLNRCATQAPLENVS